jgi:peptide deformylase
MILPIIAFGNPVLKMIADDIPENFEGLSSLLTDMFETMYAAKGVGLAAPQIGQSIRLFIVDGSPFASEEREEIDPKAIDLKKYLLIR